ncbi:MAG: hypothetical protein VW405_12575, partial [Rhodospirillaceae bacterium]
ALEEAVATVGAAVVAPPSELTTREQAALYLCHGNILAAAWAATRAAEGLDRAVNAYRQVTATVTMDDSPLDWATAQ